MQRSHIALSLLALAALLGLGWRGHRAHAADRAALAALEQRIDELAEAPAAVRDDAPIEELEGSVSELAARLRRLESGLRRAPVRPEAATTEADVPAGSAGEAPAEEERGRASGERAASEEQRREFDRLFEELAANGWDYTDRREDMERFLELARGSELLDERIAELETRVEIAPYDVEARMALADSLVGKLMTVSGPEQGLWGSRAEAQWKAVVELDDDHWGAHAALGTNYSYYPDVMGKSAEAIHHLERARELQRGLDPAPQHVSIYLFLARMYEREDEREKARDVLLEGIARHPGTESLKAALAQLD